MKKLIRRTAVLFVVFAAALLAYILLARRESIQPHTVYAVMQETSLPVVQMEMDGLILNRLPGHRLARGTLSAAETLTVLPDDRQLTVHISETAVTGIRYEIRSLDMERLVERTELEDWKSAGVQTTAVLPIQNLLTDGREYLLCLELTTEAHGPVFYYTRIVQADAARAGEYVRLAIDFSDKTFDRTLARDLTVYMEPDASADNSSYGRTTIHSGFDNLSWGDLNLAAPAEREVRLLSCDGMTAAVQLIYLTSMDAGDAQEFFAVEENFTFKWNETRTYLMSYNRTANQLFSGKSEAFSGRRILLGISDGESLSAMSSPDQKTTAFLADRELWMFSQKKNQTVKLFSFRGSTRDDVRENDRHHDIRILTVSDEGNVDFLVYGYMNRGNHEGMTGVAAYRYNFSENALEELLFIPCAGSFEMLGRDLDRLTYLSGSGMLYLYLDHAVYGIDMNSREYMAVAAGLEEDTFGVSADGERIAFQDSTETGSAVHLLDLETGESGELTSGWGESLQILGFVGRDLVCGTARAGDEWIENGRSRGLVFSSVQIINDRMEEETRYERSGCYIAQAVIDGTRIHLVRLKKTGPGQFEETMPDTIICNRDLSLDSQEAIGWYASEDMGRVYFVQLSVELEKGKGVRSLMPLRIRYEDADTLAFLASGRTRGMYFYACGDGHLLKVSADFAEAVAAAYETMGIVLDGDGRILWSRISRPSSRIIREPRAAADPILRGLSDFAGSAYTLDGILLLEARGADLLQVLYFIGRGIPVLAYGEGQTRLLLYGYDTYNLHCMDLADGVAFRMGLGDASAYFEACGSDFICALEME